MSYRNSGRAKKTPGLVISRNPTYLDENHGLLIPAPPAGKSIVIRDIMVSNVTDGKLGTSANGGGDLISYVNKKQQSGNIKVPDGKGVYTDNKTAYTSLTYYIVTTNDVAIMNSSQTGGITAPANKLCVTNAVHTTPATAALLNKEYDKESALEASKVQYKTSDGSGWIFWTTWGGGYWVIAHDNGGSYSWAYQSAEDILFPYDVSAWDLASGAGPAWSGEGSLTVNSGSCPAATTTTAAATTTTTAAPATLDIYFTAPASSSVNEGDSGTTTHGVTVTRSNGAGVATVRWYTADDTAIANTDYVSAYGTLTFQASVTTLQINITINGDVTLEGHEAFKVYLDDGSGGLNTTAPTWEIGGVTQSTPSITTNLHTVTITNDDVETKFVDGSIPDWIQPIYYETSAGIINAGDISNSGSAYPSPNVILFDAWCAPTAAACQLGHLNSTGLVLPTAASGHVDGISDLLNAGDHDNPTHGIAGTGTKAWDSAVGWGDYLVDGPSVRAAKNAMEGWYDYTGVGGTSCKLTDFGWFMNTNDSSQDGVVAGTRVTAGTATAPNASNLINLNGLGTRIHNIYLGIKDFYRHAGYSNMVGIVYHRAGDGTVPSFPSGQTHPTSPPTPEPPIGILPRYWIDTSTTSSSRAGVDEVMTWETIKTEIDQNRTVIACLQGWNVSQSSRSVAAGFPNTTHSIESAYIAGAGGPNGSGYWSLDTTNNGTGFDNTDYTADDSTDPPIWGGTALGHTVLIVGYIAKGALDDISLEKDTDWLIVRDNHENTSRNVIIPYKSDDPNSTNATNVETIRWAKDVILATVYVDQTQATYVAASPTCPHSGDGTSDPYGGTTTTTTAAAGGNNYHVTHCDGVTGTVVIDDQYGAGPVQIGDFVAWTDFSAMPYCGEVTAVDQGGTPDGSLADSTDYGDCDTCCGTHMGGPC